MRGIQSLIWFMIVKPAFQIIIQKTSYMYMCISKYVLKMPVCLGNPILSVKQVIPSVLIYVKICNLFINFFSLIGCTTVWSGAGWSLVCSQAYFKQLHLNPFHLMSQGPHHSSVLKVCSNIYGLFLHHDCIFICVGKL